MSKLGNGFKDKLGYIKKIKRKEKKRKEMKRNEIIIKLLILLLI
tara:strand:- start:373 stop:504 length:132 start_codon:yes stop_codon:yes gene_type:complete